MDTDNVGPNLSAEQFGYAYFNDHHDQLRTTRYWGSLGISPTQVQRTGRRTTLDTDQMVIPNQTHVHMSKVQEYVEEPSQRPVMLWKDPESGNDHLLDGHHRFVANRLSGRNTPAEYVNLKH